MSEKEPLLQKKQEPSRSLYTHLRILASHSFSCLPYSPLPKNVLSLDEPLDSDPLPELPYQNVSIRSSLSPGSKLDKLRRLMLERDIAVYIVPSEDEHQSEYTATADKRREFISGFMGSAGLCVITLHDESLSGEAALSTDGRYFLQAEKELDPKYWRLLKQGDPTTPSWQNYAIQEAQKSSVSLVIAVDPALISLLLAESLQRKLKAFGAHFMPVPENLVDLVWANEKPMRSTDPIYLLDLKYSGESANSKIKRIQNHLEQTGATHLVISALDEIGWLLNLRADTDIPFSPFFFAYCIVMQSEITLYCDQQKLIGVKQYIALIDGLSTRAYDQFYADLRRLKSTVDTPHMKLILASKSSCNYALVSSLPESYAKQTIVHDSIVAELKLTKNRTELDNSVIAQSKDTIAFIMFSSWLEHSLLHKKVKVTEYEAAQKMYDIRRRLPHFKGLSYETISSTGPNAAIIHYAPTKTESSVIDLKKPYLLDAGAHYLEGTTDITRTFVFGKNHATARYKKYYTLVLKGHLAVALARFPPGSTATGTILDSYARQPLWNEGLDFNHGTGHGVGSFGNVHEGPLYILTTAGGASKSNYFKPGAILTDEPGYYVDGECGFRVESELEVVECDASFGKTRGGENYLSFKYLSKIPFCNDLIDVKFLTQAEVEWINAYHKSIRLEFGPKLLMMGQKRAHAWLLKETRKL